MNFPQNQNLNNHDFHNATPQLNSNRKAVGIQDINIASDSQNEQTIQYINDCVSKDENSIDIRNFIADNEIKNTIHKISTSNDLAIIGEVSYFYSIFFIKIDFLYQ